MTDMAAGGVDVRAAARVADESLPDDERAAAEARLRATPAGRRALAQQRRVAHALRAAGPATPPGLRVAVASQTTRRELIQRRPRAPALGGALAAALLAVTVLLSGVLAREPTVVAALELGTRPATAPAPPPRASDRHLLARAVDGVPFPNWATATLMPAPHRGWMPTGARGDRLAGRRAETVFYEHQGHRVAYTIIAGDALGPPRDARRVVIGGRPLWTFRDGHRDVVVFQRKGKTCVLSGHVLHPRTLLRLATWPGAGSISS